MGKLGRKVCCDYNKDVKCIILVKGRKRCVFEETSKEQKEKGMLQIGVCALLPESERESVLAQMKKHGYANYRGWED